MPDFLSPDWFRSRWNNARSRAGRRYTPKLDVPLPIAAHFESATQDGSLFDRFSEMSLGLKNARQRIGRVLSPHLSDEQIARISAMATTLQQQLDVVVNSRNLAPTQLPIAQPLTTTHELQKEIDAPLTSFRPKSAQDLSRRAAPTTESALEALERLSGMLRRLDDEFDSREMAAANNPYMLLLGGPGTGKTHLLCRMTVERIDRGVPALLFMGQAFQTPFTDAFQALTDSVAPGLRGEDFLQSLNEDARQHSVRCLISIDAINEGHRDSWTAALPKLIEECKRYSAVALVISCRSPFDKLLVPDPSRLGLHVFTHYGFPPEQQTNAVETYFKGYGIPLPEVPLLEEEFSNPLFLKIFCEAIEKVTLKQQHAQIHSLASGQRGMTHVLEYFVKQKDRILSRELGTPAGLSWKFLKDHFAAAIAQRHSEGLPLADARALADKVQPAGLAPGAFLQALINEDLLAEDLEFTTSTPQEVVRFTYQKFADHLIARHLLRTQLDPSSPQTIRASLRDPRGLGSYFSDPDKVLLNVNIVEALMVEFPARVQNSGELLQFLSWKSFPVRLGEAVVRGLYWRDPQRSINASTGRLMDLFLKHESLRELTLNALTALAVKPQHPFSAARIDKYLSRLSMVERDLFWTEYLRRSIRNEGTPERLLIWAEHSVARAPSKEFAVVYTTLFKWFLTSTQRAFRDRATHALFRLGLAHPTSLFAATLESLAANDPYVPERMLAASYGVVMAQWRSPESRHFQSHVLPEYARGLFRRLFARDAKHGTTHILSRDYAHRTIELALMLHPTLLSAPAKKLVKPPFRFGGIRRWKETDDRDEEKYREGDAPLHMDFANYTIGRLVRGRGNYDNSHLEYQRVKRQILRRIYDLGYKLETFSTIDREIARTGFYQEQPGREAGKTERYGKKYSWIAFYEVAGYRQDHGLLDRDDPRISDADIDPSFPEYEESPKLFQPWIDDAIPLQQWIRSGYKPPVEDRLVFPTVQRESGPWIILDAFVNQSTPDKKISSIFSGLLVRSRDQATVARLLSSIEYPGNHEIPQAEDEYCTYAGEIPWANTWRPRQYPATIRSDRDETEIFVPVRDYSWESYHSQENRLRNVRFPSKELAQALGLYVRVPQLAIAEIGSARPAMLPVISGDPYRNHESVLLIRQDLLDQYLARNDQRLLLFVWGERRANYQDLTDARTAEGHFELPEVLHKQGFVYEGGAFRRFC